MGLHHALAQRAKYLDADNLRSVSDKNPDENIPASDDAIDAIVEEWEAQRPDLDARPLAIFSRFLRLSRHIDHIRREVFSHYGLESWEFEILTELRRRKNYELTAGQLMRKTLVSSGTITNRIDRLEAKRLVQRVADPSDGRVVIARLTDEGIASADEAMAALLERQRALLSPYTQAELATVTSFLRSILSELDETEIAKANIGKIKKA